MQDSWYHNRLVRRLLTVCLCLTFCLTGSAITVTNLTSGDSTNVQFAVNNTSYGDIIVLPGGAWWWTNQVHFTNRVIRGSPLGDTTIYDNRVISGSADNQALFLAETLSTATNFVHIAGLNIIAGTNNVTERTGGTFRFNGQGFARLDHNTITFTIPFNRGGYANDGVTGVADHNTFLTDGTQNFFVEHGSWKSGSGNFGDNSWAQPSLLGTTNAWYIEDHTTTNNPLGEANIVDSQRGGRWVVRYSRFQHGTAHGAEVAGNRVRGTRQWEIYNNVMFTDNAENNVLEMRSGSGVIYGNTATNGLGAYTKFADLTIYRSENQPYFWGAFGISSGWDINTAGAPFIQATNDGGTVSGTFTDSHQAWTNNALRGFTYTNHNNGQYSLIIGNTATSFTFNPKNGSGFTNGQVITIWQSTDGLDITGNGQCDLNSDSTPKWLNFTKERVWGWNNNFNGTTNGTLVPSHGGEYVLVEGLFWSNNVAKPGYTALVYPHPVASDPVLSPATTNVTTSTTVNFAASSGFTPYTQYFMVAAPSGGSINPSTGVYTAGTNPSTTDTVGVYDALGGLGTASVTVSGSSPPPGVPGFSTFRLRRRG